MSANNPAFEVVGLQAIAPQTISSATSTNGTAIDASRFDQAMLRLDFGAVTGAAGTCEVKLQECATSGGTYTDIAGATTGAIVQGTGIASKKVCLYANLRARMKYIRVQIVTASTTTSIVIAAAEWFLTSSQKSIDPTVEYDLVAAGANSG